MATRQTYKTFRYSNRLAWTGARRGQSSVSGKPDVAIGSPPEFKGEPGQWSPEDLLVGALNACLMLTFISMAQAKGVQFTAYESDAEGLLENLDGKYQITAVEVRPNVAVTSEAELAAARAIMDRVEEHCFISKSIKAKVTLTPQFRVAAAAQ